MNKDFQLQLSFKAFPSPLIKALELYKALYFKGQAYIEAKELISNSLDLIKNEISLSLISKYPGKTQHKS